MNNRDEKSLYAQEGYELIGAAMEVHNTQGGGLAEEIYQQSLELELAMRQIPFQAKDQLEVFYKGLLLKTTYIPDLVVFGVIIAELKAVRAVGDEHAAQLINYLRVLRRPVGYVINFGPIAELEWRRFICSEFL